MVINVLAPVVVSGGSSTLQKLSFRNTNSKAPNGVQVNAGTLIMSECNISCKGGSGAAVIVDASAFCYMKNCRVSGAAGSGIYVARGSIALYDSIISHNRQNGVSVLGGVAILQGNKIQENRGYGVSLLGNGSVNLSTSPFIHYCTYVSLIH